jgi:ubiquinone/menaquinone biosynthesis C-methylase UbiE
VECYPEAKPQSGFILKPYKQKLGRDTILKYEKYKVEDHRMGELENKFYVFDTVELEVKDFESDGFILDIGGGGEGVIGRLKGRDVVAIDIRREELEEAVDGPLKIVMDARDLKFLDGSFNTATAFFSMMYIKNREDQIKTRQQRWRHVNLLMHRLELIEPP